MSRCKVRILSLTQDDIVFEQSFDNYPAFSAFMMAIERYFSSSDQYRIIIDFNH